MAGVKGPLGYTADLSDSRGVVVLVIRVNGKRPIKLERKLSESGGWGLWDFHRAESSYTLGVKTHRLARIRPAEPAAGKPVELFIMREASAPESEWISFGEGVAAYESDS
ncbi:hypothetical protein A471_23108 [Ectopseudomonas mendocina DLHK]|nr:hypothetical protein A471_23108 [Pseudomonas mendocina DLHK]